MTLFKLKVIFISLLAIFLMGAVEASQEASLSVSPLIREIEIEPGASWTGHVEVFNSNPEEFDFKVSVMDFVGRGEGYAHFLQRSKLDGYALSDWISFQDEKVTIGPGESHKFLFTVDVPEEAAPGGIYAGIIATAAEEDEEGSGMAVAPSVSSLLFVNIEGEYYEKIDILDFSTNSLFYDKIEIPFNVKIMNMGNVHVRPEGSVAVLRGEEELFAKKINPHKGYGNILPNTERNWNFLWEDEDSIFNTGKYQAKLDLTYGRDEKRKISETIEFWVIPSKRQLVLLAIFLVALLLSIVRVSLVYYRFYHKKKESLD